MDDPEPQTEQERINRAVEYLRRLGLLQQVVFGELRFVIVNSAVSQVKIERSFKPQATTY